MFKNTSNRIQNYLIRHMHAIEFWFVEIFDPHVMPYSFHDGKSLYEPTDYTKSNKVRSKKSKKKSDGNLNSKTLSQ